ncbi:hypothetical protein HERIO_687 [Hepatospora eriocheir]|uniref:Uncharacterized protein n=1 Tax=Hepatospora eriocheir TaxID=1081669 RepID=A0A1X0QCN9_9MICR|nr:hypothetical protein HERIO_687 [Hepatospora eriocheir]
MEPTKKLSKKHENLNLIDDKKYKFQNLIDDMEYKIIECKRIIDRIDNEDQITNLKNKIARYEYRRNHYIEIINQITDKTLAKKFKRINNNSLKKFKFPIIALQPLQIEDYELSEEETEFTNEQFCYMGHVYNLRNRLETNLFELYKFDHFISTADHCDDLILIGTKNDESDHKIFDFSSNETKLIITDFNLNIKNQIPVQGPICKIKLFKKREKYNFFTLFNNGSFKRYEITENYEINEIWNCEVCNIIDFSFELIDDKEYLIYTNGKMIYSDDYFTTEFIYPVISLAIGAFDDVIEYYMITSVGKILACNIKFENFRILRYLKGVVNMKYNFDLNGLIVNSCDGEEQIIIYTIKPPTKSSNPVVYINSYYDGIIHAYRNSNSKKKHNFILQFHKSNNLFIIDETKSNPPTKIYFPFVKLIKKRLLIVTELGIVINLKVV